MPLRWGKKRRKKNKARDYLVERDSHTHVRVNVKKPYYNATDKEEHRRYVAERSLSQFQMNLLNEDYYETKWETTDGDLYQCISFCLKIFS